MLHPCSSFDGECCSEDVAPVGLQYSSSSNIPDAKVELSYEVWPQCGDGLVVTLIHFHGNFTQTLFATDFEPGMKKAQLQVAEYSVGLKTASTLRLVAYPRDSHDCDAVQIHSFKIWRTRTFQ